MVVRWRDAGSGLPPDGGVVAKLTAATTGVAKPQATRRRGLCKPGQCLKASLILSAACLAFPLAFSARPLVLSRRFPVTRPVPCLTAPLAVCALCLILLRMLTVLPVPGILSATARQAMDAPRRVYVVAGT
jgi:hypothetical protein